MSRRLFILYFDASVPAVGKVYNVYVDIAWITWRHLNNTGHVKGMINVCMCIAESRCTLYPDHLAWIMNLTWILQLFSLFGPGLFGEGVVRWPYFLLSSRSSFGPSVLSSWVSGFQLSHVRNTLCAMFRPVFLCLSATGSDLSAPTNSPKWML